MNKAELRKALDEKNIPYAEKENVKALKSKLTQAELSTPPVESHVPFMLMDNEDESQILAEMQGAVIATFVYCFSDKRSGKEVVGLSKAGVDQACRESSLRGEIYRIIKNPITGKPCEIEEDDKFIKVVVEAGHFVITKDRNGKVLGEQLLNTAIGSKRQAKNMKSRDGKIMPNPFAFEVALSKAERNAKMKLLPYKFILEMIKNYRNKGNVQMIEADKLISDAQIRFIHQVASEHGLDHAKMTAFLTKCFGYKTLNELMMREVNPFIEKIKTEFKVSVPPEIPVDLLGLFNSKGIMKAKREVLWVSALKACGNDEKKAVEFIQKQIASE
jgi:hypothetical protein